MHCGRKAKPINHRGQYFKCRVCSRLTQYPKHRVFCSGKISDGNMISMWRREIGLTEYPRGLTEGTLEAPIEEFNINRWTVRHEEFDYVGPYRISWAERGNDMQSKIYEICKRQVATASHLFVWIDADDCYGALTEVAWTRPDQFVFIAYPKDQAALMDEMWFVNKRANNEEMLFADVEEAWETFKAILREMEPVAV